MTTTMSINGKRQTLTIEQKARLLRVIDIHEQCILVVLSGSKENAGYAVQHDGREATKCPCAACGRCAHKLAVN